MTVTHDPYGEQSGEVNDDENFVKRIRKVRVVRQVESKTYDLLYESRPPGCEKFYADPDSPTGITRGDLKRLRRAIDGALRK